MNWAHSKMVLRVHGMDEAGVRFPVGPQSDIIYHDINHY